MVPPSALLSSLAIGAVLVAVGLTVGGLLALALYRGGRG
jgi:ABC-type spermidine/putrescine transport system permease subunit II